MVTAYASRNRIRLIDPLSCNIKNAPFTRGVFVAFFGVFGHTRGTMKRVDLALTSLLIPTDLFAIFAGAVTAYLLRFATFSQTVRPVVFELTLAGFFQIILATAPLFILLFALSGLYALRSRGIILEALRIFVATSAGMALFLAVGFLSRDLFESRFIFLVAWILITVFVIFGRQLIRLLRLALQRRGIGVMAIAVIGTSPTAKELLAYFNGQKSYRVVDRFATWNKLTEKTLLSYRESGRLDAIYLADAESDRRQIDNAKAFADHSQIAFYYSADLVPGQVLNPIFHTINGIPMIEVPKTPLDGWGAIYKRGVDILGALLLILLTLPLQIPIALILILERNGGVIYAQQRIGLNGRPFSFLKFRSMRKNAHKEQFDPEFLKKHGNNRDDAIFFKLKDDPRVTRFGRFIRKYSLDELPQLYLVLVGKMSLVGSRPHLPEEVAKYPLEAKRIFTLKPGITGMAQVSGRADLRFEDEIRLDLHYLENWSPLLDLVIILKTPLVVLLKKGAY